MAMSPNQPDPNEMGGYRPLAEMNVTPLVDVMLVLLIIFMVAAPLMISGVNLELPRTSAEPLPQVKERLVLSVTSDGSVYIEDKEIDRANLATELKAMKTDGHEDTIFVRGDSHTEYGTIMEVLSDLGKAGFSDLSLLTEEPQGSK